MEKTGKDYPWEAMYRGSQASRCHGSNGGFGSETDGPLQTFEKEIKVAMAQ